MKKILLKTLPWIITIIALYLAFKGVHITEVTETILAGNPLWLALAVVFTIFSYVLRAYRWQFLFPSKVISFSNAYKVLILGFFMNNILPARAGEIVRAHLGAKFTNTKRTLVLATVASERLTDGLMLSIMFVIYVLLTPKEAISNGMLLVAGMFFIATFMVLLLLLLRKRIFGYAENLANRFNNKAILYAVDRFQVFINGLAPMFNRRRLPITAALTIIIWTIELLAYYFIVRAFSAELSLFSCILFLAAVNFSSLIPAAPAGIGVIEAVASGVLVAHGLDKGLALSMVISQHLIQILVIAIPGTYFAITLKKHLNSISTETNDES